MAKFFFRLVINALALFAAVSWVPGIIPQDPTNPYAYLWLAIIFGLLNTFLKPAVKVITCLINVFTLGLFTLIINTLMFYLAGYIGTQYGIGFTIDNFWAGFLGALVVTIISTVFNFMVPDRLFRKKRPKIKIK